MPEITLTAFDAPQRLRVFGGNVADYPPGATHGPRTLRDYEFVWMLRGDARWQVDGMAHAAPAGSVFLCRPGMRDRICWDGERATRHGFLHFMIDPRPDDSDWPLVRHPQGDEILLPLLRHALWLRWQDPAAALAQCSAALLLALHVFCTGRWGQAGHHRPELEHPVLRAVFALVARTWRGGVLLPLSLPQLAAAGGVSPNHLIRLFRRELGATPQQVLRHLRLERAADLLIRLDDPIAAIAERCGFASQFHFARRFKQVYGRSPSHFRRHIRTGGDMPGSPVLALRRIARSVF